MKLKEIKKSNLIFMDEVPQNEVKKIIDKIEKKPITSYYKFSLIGNTQNDVEKDDLGYMEFLYHRNAFPICPKTFQGKRKS